jgi:putative alpha-1,2-mannosidase
LSGNEDCGQMLAWYVFSVRGLYPYNLVFGEYQIASPIFDKSIIKMPNNTIFTIIADGTSDENMYIQSATLNGIEFNRTSITHKELLEGGTLHFQMENTPNKKWGILLKL